MKKEKHSENVERPNKSQLKRDLEALRDQTTFIAKLKQDKLDKLELSPIFLDAIDELKRIKNTNAIKRHIQFMTKILSEHGNLDHIQSMLFEYQNPHLKHQLIDRKVEHYLKEIIEGENETAKASIDELIALPQVTNRQNFLQLIRNAQREFSNTENVNKNAHEEPILKAPDGKHIKKLKKILRVLFN